MATFAQPLAARPSLLRRALQADAVVSAVSAAGLIVGAGALGPALGIPSAALLAVGIAFVPWAAFLTYLSTRPTIGRRAAWAVVIVNALWVVDSIVLLASGALPLTPAGFWFVVAQAVAVDTLAVAQFLGLRRAAKAA